MPASRAGGRPPKGREMRVKARPHACFSEGSIKNPPYALLEDSNLASRNNLSDRDRNLYD